MISWHEKAWQDYIEWTNTNKTIAKKINLLIKDAKRHPFEGLGKPEALTGDLVGLWSRRIDEKHRLVYRVTEKGIEIAQCKGHYKDK